jgi:4-carboxymuconolactone decarboxylase
VLLKSNPSPKAAMTNNSRYTAGMAVRRQVLGAKYVDRATAGDDQRFNTPLQRLVTEYCWGEIWTRDGLDRRTRSLVNLGMLSALRQWSELELHLRGALSNGCTPEEIQETLLQATVYCGVPAGVEAFRIAERVLTGDTSDPSSEEEQDT